MIDVRQLKNNKSIIEIKPGDWNPQYWKPIIRELSFSDEQIIFRINHIDDSGLVSVVLKYWLKYSKTIFVETRHNWIKEVLKLAFQDEVKFR